MTTFERYFLAEKETWTEVKNAYYRLIEKEETADMDMISIDDCLRDGAIEELRSLDVNTLTPYEALQYLYNLQRKLR